MCIRSKAIKKNRYRILSVLAVLTCILVLFMGGKAEVAANERIVKVGYMDMGGFLEEMEGEYTGYAVEYLEEIAKYTGWEYEYICKSWEECLRGLETGEIDLVCMAHYDKERAKKFLYADFPFGYEYTVMYARADSVIYYQDYAAMSGCKVGLIEGTMHADEFKRFAEREGLSYDVVYYGNDEDAIEALHAGAVEVAVVGSLNSHNDLKLVNRFAVQSFYCITGEGNTALMDTLNKAMEQIKLDYPEIENKLYVKYSRQDQSSSVPLFTKAEKEYIENAEPIVIKLMLETCPLGYTEDGEPKGIFVEYLNLLSEVSGLEFKIEETTSMTFDEQTRKMLEEDYVTLRAKRAIEAIGLDEELVTSIPLIETKLAYVKTRRAAAVTGRTDYTFAITNEMSYLPPLLQEKSADYKIKYYNDAVECLEAVIRGEADIAVQDYYVTDYWLDKPEYAEKLVMCPGQDCVNNMCLIAPESMSTLVQIIDKTINYISDEEINNVVSMTMLMNPYKKNFNDMIYEYWRWLVFLAVVGFVTLCIYTFLLRGMTRLSIRKQEYEKLQERVQRDELTGVYNRGYFYEAAKEMIDSTDENMCIVLMDISNFKVVNDLYGIETGDNLLCCMADELVERGKGRDFLVARFTGDHFYMCMRKSDFLDIKFPKRYNTFLEDIDITVTYGVFVVDDQKDVPVNIMCDRASMAAHKMERSRGEYIRYYSEGDRQQIIREQEITSDFEKALEGHQFCAYVQPKYDIEKGTIVGGEALVRWKHPRKGMISPGLFIPVFEKNGAIIRLDYCVWEETCRLISEMKQKGITTYPISINVSRAHFYGTELQEKLEELIGKYQLRPDDLELEITESICAEDTDIIYKKIRRLQEAGFKVAMDDFGSGYSSLNMLKEIPLDIIKMDLKFLDGGGDQEKSRYILQTLINLAQNMKLNVVVEGVETKEQVEFLKDIGNCYAQGYYYSRPVESTVYEEMLSGVQ